MYNTTSAGAPHGADWFTSSYSNDQGGDCVEGARLGGDTMAVRDTKRRAHGTAHFPHTTWQPFLTALTTQTLTP